MKVVFVGPSLPDARGIASSDIEIRPPASQGDVMRAVGDGATAIGLIDGLFEFVAPVWHKELLFALSRDIAVLGAASMGALRAAECLPYGMGGVGQIYDDYRCGRRVDDGDVALLHGPAALGYPAVTEPLVNVDATLARARQDERLSHDSCEALAKAARSLFFKDRTWRRMADIVGIEWSVLRYVLSMVRVDQKRLDAVALLDMMAASIEPAGPRHWTFNATPLWRRMYPPGATAGQAKDAEKPA